MNKPLLTTALTVLLGSMPPMLAAQGAIHGTVVTKNGKELTGTLRWDDEEYLWIQSFNGLKAGPPDISQLSNNDQDKVLESIPGPQLKVFNRTIEFVKWLSDEEIKTNEFSLRFGSIKQMDFEGRQRVTITLNDGSTLKGDSGSNDFGADIFVRDSSGSENEIDWSEIKQIRFSPAPQDANQFNAQLFGTVRTKHGEFTGQVVWDADERYAREVLDWEEDGREESAQFSEISSIRNAGNASTVTFREGQQKTVTGTNDVDEDNRGIMVVGSDFGLATIAWDDFISVDFHDAVNTDTKSVYTAEKPLRANINAGGNSYNNVPIIIDLDRSHSAEALITRLGSSELRIPLSLIQSMEPSEGKLNVTLDSGKRFNVATNTGGNASPYLIVINNGSPTLLPWKDINRVELIK